METPVEGPSKSRAVWFWVGLTSALVTVGLGPAVFCSAFGRSFPQATAGILLYLGGLLYLLVLTVCRIARRQRDAALAMSLLLALCLVPGALVTIGVVSFARAFQSEDGFANDLTIPADLDVAVPLPEPKKGPGGAEDAFQRALVSAWSTAPTSDPCVVPSLPSLRILALEHPSLLVRYLASSCAWRVFEQDSVRCATRRWKLADMWLWKMHGYYLSHDVRPWPDPEIIRALHARMMASPDANQSGTSSAGGVTYVPGIEDSFQVRTTIGLDGKPWAPSRYGVASQEEGIRPVPVRLDRRWPFDSHLVIRCGGMVAELFEQSEGPERRLTKAMLRELEAEFKTVLDQTAFATAPLPPDSIRRGQPVLNLYKGMQPGIYEVEAWVNPGESGLVYLKAFEVTHDTRLSTHRLREYSNERTGWSDDPNELFYSNTHVTIYEGDWGHPYAARFELWFVPDSGQPERSLLERVFRIEGWQR